MLGGVEHIGLETVQRLHGEDFPCGAGEGGDFGESFNHPVGAGLHLVGAARQRRAACKHHRLAVKRPADDLGAKDLGAFNAGFEVIEPALPRARLLRGNRALRVDAGGQHHAEVGLLQRGFRRCQIYAILGFGHQKLDEIKAHRLDVLEQMQVLSGEGPHELHRDNANRVFQNRDPYPLTAPAVMPAIRRFCMKRNRSVAGIAPTIPPAVSSPHSTWYSPMRVWIATVIGFTLRPPRVSA